MGATASIFSNALFRGYSLSDERPVAILDVAFDDRSGLYAGVAATGVLRRGGDPAPLSLQLNGGYAKRLASGTTIDLGATHSSYSHYASGGAGSSDTEVYAGIARGPVSSRIFLSPHYFQRGRWTAYGEINANVSPARKWTFDGHVGALVPLRTPAPNESYRVQLDWRIGVTRELGRLSLHSAWSDRASSNNPYATGSHGKGALVVGATWLL